MQRAALALQFPVIFGPSVSDLPVLPNEIVRGKLYLGSAATNNERALDALGITHIVSVVERNLTPPAGRARLLCKIPDTDDAPLLPVLRKALPFISRAMRGGGRVLVHCERGASRSVSVCCAHMMLSQGHELPTIATALDYVKERRTCAQPNAGFLAQLLSIDVHEWREWLRALLEADAAAGRSDSEAS